MAVKVLIVASAVLFCLALGDVSHLKQTSINTNKATVDTQQIKDTKTAPKSPRLQSRQAVLGLDAGPKPKAHEGYGYIYRKPSIPFITGNQVHQGYDYPKPANPMTYPPPAKPTEPSFPDATARLRAK